MALRDDGWEENTFITWLPNSNRKLVFFVVDTKLSKCAHFLIIKKNILAMVVAKAFISDIVKLYGFQKKSFIIETLFYEHILEWVNQNKWSIKT